MATITQLATIAQNAAAAAIGTLCDGGSLKLYDGDDATLPGVNGASDGTLLATIPLDATAFGSPASGVITLADLDPVNWAADGTCDYYRFCKSDGSTVWQGNVTTTAGDGSLKLSSVTAVSGSPVDVTSFTLTVPSGV